MLRAAGHEVVATDLVDYGPPITPPGYFGSDFLMERKAPEGTEAIVTNPPFKLAEEFVGHALDLCPRVIMLLRLAFLESERRRGILEDRGLARVHIFRNRLPMMHRDSWAGPKASSAVAYGWFSWRRGHQGPPTLHRISWRSHDERPAHAHGLLGQGMLWLPAQSRETRLGGGDRRRSEIARHLSDAARGRGRPARRGGAAMTAVIIPFEAPIFVREIPGDGWLVSARGHGWLHGDRRSAIADARWLSRNLQLPMRDTSRRQLGN